MSIPWILPAWLSLEAGNGNGPKDRAGDADNTVLLVKNETEARHVRQ